MRIPRDLNKMPLPRYRANQPVRQRCYLCGADGEMTREHVFARSTFRPNDLDQPLILSACVKCNGLKEKDEDYANAVFIATTETAPVHEPRQRQFERLAKLKAREQPGQAVPGLGIHNKMVGSLTDVHLVDENGKSLGIGGQFPMEAERIKQFYLRIFKGIHTAAIGEVTNWDDYEIRFQFDNVSFKQHINDEAYQFPIKNAQYVEGWGEHLLFAGLTFGADGRTSSMWSLALYGEQLATVSFVELQQMKEHLKKHPEQA
jgi:hypothetical protein